jgi:arylsulfatase A-like enzyme
MSPKPPNIILIVLDTVGAKHLSLYGYQRPTTPNLERIAAECSVYSRCFAPACWTVPSHASMFTGLYPSQHGAFESRFLLRDNLPHLVPILKAQGYTTIGISTNSLVSPASAFARILTSSTTSASMTVLASWRAFRVLTLTRPPQAATATSRLACRQR